MSLFGIEAHNFPCIILELIFHLIIILFDYVKNAFISAVSLVLYVKIVNYLLIYPYYFMIGLNLQKKPDFLLKKEGFRK